jgi:tetratricopeptide (TPR) repeat protein
MFRRSLFFIIAAVVIALVQGSSFAQTGELRGSVVIQQADGTKVPASEAQVDVYRTDLNGKYETKTNKRGAFAFAGLPYVGDYTVVISHPNAAPTWQDRVKAGRGNELSFVLTPGDGKRPTLEEIRAATAMSSPASSGTESATDKAKREELLKKNEEIKAANAKAEQINAVVSRTFKAGNDAVKAGNFDEAIKQFDEGIAADPEQAALLTNKANALKQRGVMKYNEALKVTDDAAKSAGFTAAKADFTAAKETSSKAVELIKKQASAATDPTEQQRQNLNKLAALNIHAEAMRLFVTKVDPTQADAGASAYQEYLAAETDAERKAKAEQALAQMLFDSNAFDKALVQYQKILETNPDNLEALLRSGMALFNIGAMNNNDKAKYQEAANYLARFVEKAPDTDAMKADAQAILQNLKDQENVKPEKTAAPARRRRP